VTLDDAFLLSPMDFYGRNGMQVSYSDHLSSKELYWWMIRLYVNFYGLSFVRRPWRALATVARVFLKGREETRYAKWFRDVFKTRRKWRAAAQQRPAADEALFNVEIPSPVPGAEVLVSLPVIGGEPVKAGR
jgi:hypothetical protein